MNLIPIFAIFLGITLLLGSIPPSVSDPEIPPFANPNAVSHMSETATDVLDNLPEPKSDNERKKKFDVGFYDKIQQKIKHEYDSTEYHTVIIYLKTDDISLYPEGLIQKSRAMVNKDLLAYNLEKVHDGKNIFKAKELSFVSAQIPVKEIPKLADYEFSYLIGDGESKVQFQLDTSKGQIGVPLPAPNSSLNGTGIDIAVIDTGIHLHDDLENSITKNMVCEITDCPSSSTDYDDDFSIGHGTNVAGIIAGKGVADSNKSGIAPGANLFNVKINDGDLFDTPGNGDMILKALDWSVDNQARVINMSFAINGTADGGLYTIVSLGADEAADLGAVVVVAQGNKGTSPIVTPPATGFNVISVGNMDTTNIPFTIDDSSSLGPTSDLRIKPDLTAPGKFISSPKDGTNNEYVDKSGTSIAAPHVSGAAALLLESHPELSPLKLKTALITGADLTGSSLLTAKIFDDCVVCRTDLNQTGFGMINVPATLDLINDGNKIIEDLLITNSSIKEYGFSVVNGEPIKLFLSWFKHPGGVIKSPTTGTISDLNMELLDAGDNQILFSNSDTQNTEFIFYTPTVTSNNWKVKITGSLGSFYEPFVVSSNSSALTPLQEVECLPDSSRSYDWIVGQDCVLVRTSIANHNVIVRNSANFTIPDNRVLLLDFTENHLLIEEGSMVNIRDGGKIG